MRTRRRRRGDSEQAETSYGAERYTLTHTHTCTLRLGHTLGEIERASKRESILHGFELLEQLEESRRL